MYQQELQVEINSKDYEIQIRRVVAQAEISSLSPPCDLYMGGPWLVIAWRQEEIARIDALNNAVNLLNRASRV